MALALALGLGLLGCGRESEPKSADVLRINLSTGISSLDVAQASNQSNIWAVSQLYEGLLTLDSNLRPIGALADSFGVSSDGLSWKFRLRQGILFHSDSCFGPAETREVIADDVVFSLFRILDPQTGSAGSAILRSALGQSATGKSIRSSGNYHVEITLTTPYAALPSILAAPIMGVIAREAVEKYGKDVRRNPIGTGPFRLGYWIEGEKLVLHRNSRYRLPGLPKLKAVEINSIESRLTEFFALIQGRIDLLSGLDAARELVLDSTNELKAELRGQIEMQRWPFLNTEYIGITLEGSGVSAELKNRDVRKALSMSIDRETMMRFLRRGIGQPAWNGMVPEELHRQCIPVTRLQYDPEEARKIMKALGYTPEKPLEVTLYTIQQYADLMLFAAKGWQAIGADVKVETMAASPLRELRKAGGATMFRGSWIADYADAESYLSLFHSPNIPPNGPNYTRYRNDFYGESYRKASAGEGEQVCRMIDMLNRDIPAIPLFHDQAVTLSSTRVSGFRLNALNIPDLRWTTVEGKE